MKFVYFILSALVVLQASDAEPIKRWGNRNQGGFDDELNEGTYTPIENEYRGSMKGEKNNMGQKLQDSVSGEYEQGNELKLKVTEGRFRKRNVLDTAKEAYNYIVHEMNEIQQILKGKKSKSDVENAIIMRTDDMPKFEDPCTFGNYSNKHKLIEFYFTNIQVNGMSEFGAPTVSIKSDEQTATLKMQVPSLTVKGDYKISNFLKTTAGKFQVMLNNVQYTEKDTFTTYVNDIDIQSTAEGTIEYENSEGAFKNLGVFSRLFESLVNEQLLDNVLQKIAKDVSYKMRHVVASKIRQITYNQDKTQNLNHVQEILKSSISESRKYVKLQGLSTMEIPYSGNQLVKVDEFFKMKIFNVILHGLDSYHLVGNVHTIVQNDDIEIRFKIAIGPLTGVTYVQTDDADVDSPVNSDGKLDVRFEIENVNNEIVLAKRLQDDNSAFKLKHVHLDVLQLVIRNVNEYTGRVRDCMNEKLPEALKKIVNANLSTVFRQRIEGILRDSNERTFRDGKFFGQWKN